MSSFDCSSLFCHPIVPSTAVSPEARRAQYLCLPKMRLVLRTAAVMHKDNRSPLSWKTLKQSSNALPGSSCSFKDANNNVSIGIDERMNKRLLPRHTPALPSSPFTLTQRQTLGRQQRGVTRYPRPNPVAGVCNVYLVAL